MKLEYDKNGKVQLIPTTKKEKDFYNKNKPNPSMYIHRDLGAM